jgi:hypothetical protein
MGMDGGGMGDMSGMLGMMGMQGMHGMMGQLAPPPPPQQPALRHAGSCAGRHPPQPRPARLRLVD